MLTIIIEGDIAFLKKLNNFASDVEDILEEQIALSIDEIYNRSQMLVPTQIEGGGSLRATAYKEVQKLQGEVGYATVMAAYYEFGTGAFIDIPPGLEEYAMTFYINGQGRIPANAFLFPSFYAVGREFGPEVLERINKLWKG